MSENWVYLGVRETCQIRSNNQNALCKRWVVACEGGTLESKCSKQSRHHAWKGEELALWDGDVISSPDVELGDPIAVWDPSSSLSTMSTKSSSSSSSDWKSAAVNPGGRFMAAAPGKAPVPPWLYLKGQQDNVTDCPKMKWIKLTISASSPPASVSSIVCTRKFWVSSRLRYMSFSV